VSTGSDSDETGFQLLGLPAEDDESGQRARAPFEMLVSQFVEELRRGGRPSIELYARRFPPHAERIREVFPVLAMLERARLDRESRSIRRNMPGSFPFTRLGHFELLQEIGRGGMGVVFRAKDQTSGHLVALKILPWRAAVVPEWVARFESEARTAGEMRHPGIVPVYKYGQEDGYSYIAMQLIPGVGLDRVIQTLGHQGRISLRDLVENAGLAPVEPAATAGRPGSEDSQLGTDSWAAFTSIALQAAQALRGAHQAGVCHNDIKPANLLLGVGCQVWVTDFGLSGHLAGRGERAKEPARAAEEQEGGGTLKYMAPERFIGHTSASADCYSLGATLYELSLQCSPFAHDDRQQLREQILKQPPLRPRELCPEFPVALETIILNCLQKRPEDRYESADALIADLLRLDRGLRIRSTRRNIVRRIFGG
jgi:serine/threonine protein kinase